MHRIILTARERAAVFGAFSVWDRHNLRRGALEAEAARHGVAAVDAYVTLLHLDTLHVLGQGFPTVWKGGTAIQTLLPPMVQRVSVDLDFNSTTSNVEVLREAIEAANQRLADNGKIVTVQGVPIGRFYQADHRPAYRTIEFRRLLPSLFDDKVELSAGTFEGVDDDIRVQGRLSRVQINYGHHEMPAIQPEDTTVAFFTQPALAPLEQVRARCSSVHDLVADKILATTRHGGFGRERFKDLYDLIALRHHGGADAEIVRRKLERITGTGSVERIIEGSTETLRILGVEVAAAQGFRNAVCLEGKEWVRDWERQLQETVDWLLTFGEG